MVLLGKGPWNTNANHGEDMKPQIDPSSLSREGKPPSPGKKATNTATFRSLVKTYFSWKKTEKYSLSRDRAGIHAGSRTGTGEKQGF